MKFGVVFFIFFLNVIYYVKAEITDGTTTTLTPIQSRFFLNQIRLEMMRSKNSPNAAIQETLEQKMKRKRCERLGKSIVRLRGLRLRFYNRYCVNPDPTDLPPKDYDYS
jgi:hypothetical protein